MRIRLREHIAENIIKIRRELLALHYACRNPETGLLPGILILVTIGYALSPVDLIPDFIPIIGYLDDLVIIPALIYCSIKLIPDAVMQDARNKAEKTEIKLRKRWFFGFIFIILWIIILLLLIKHYSNTTIGWRSIISR